MAGRPKAKARRFAAWEERLWDLVCEFSRLVPRRRQQPDDSPDFWEATSLHLARASITAGILRYELEEKAGLDAEQLEKDREIARGLRSEDVKNNATQNAEGAGVYVPPKRLKLPRARARVRAERGHLVPPPSCGGHLQGRTPPQTTRRDVFRANRTLGGELPR